MLLSSAATPMFRLAAQRSMTLLSLSKQMSPLAAGQLRTLMPDLQGMGGTPPNVTVLLVRRRTEGASAPAAVGVVAAAVVPAAAVAAVVSFLHLLPRPPVRATMMETLLERRPRRRPLPTTGRPSVSRWTRRIPRWIHRR